MQRAHLRFGQWVLILALLSATGAQWLALQSIAWGAMFVDFARDSSFGTAIVKTFDGAHPCELCKTIEQARTTEKKSVAVVVVKIDLFHQPHSRLIVKAVPAWELSIADCRADSRGEPPLHPPPRGLAG